MDDSPFFASDDEPEVDAYLGMPASTLLAVVFVMLLTPALLTGAFTALTAVMTVVALFVDIPTNPGEPPMYVIAPIESCMCMVPTVLYGMAAIGVFRRKTYGWYMGLIGLLMCMGGCLAPLALFGMYALLCKPGRRAFGMK